MTKPATSTAMARSAGFTLLETMVAMVVFAGAAMALYALFNTNLTALGRVHDASRQMTAARHAIEHLAGINPREASAGRVELDGTDLLWSARLLEPRAPKPDRDRGERLLRDRSLRDRVRAA